MEARVQTPAKIWLVQTYLSLFQLQFTCDDHFVTCDHPMVEVKPIYQVSYFENELLG